MWIYFNVFLILIVVSPLKIYNKMFTLIFSLFMSFTERVQGVGLNSLI